MMQRVRSETRRAGMVSDRHCHECGELLLSDVFDLCTDCRPRLSANAQQAGAIRRIEREEFEALERAVNDVEALVRKLKRKMQW